MEPRNPRHGATSGAASWWLLLALVLVASFGFYIWFQQNRAPATAPRPIQVAQADSSGPIPTRDTMRAPDRRNGVTFPYPQPADTGPFIAPSPGFANSSAGPVANLIAYARRMLFDPSRGTEFALPTDEYGRTREVRVEPLANLRLLDSVAFAEGRIVARVMSAAALPGLALHNGENFIWVQGSLGNPLVAEVWSGTSVVVPAKRLPLSYSPRPPINAPDDKDAFWVGNDIDDRVLWIACGRGWCHS